MPADLFHALDGRMLPESCGIRDAGGPLSLEALEARVRALVEELDALAVRVLALSADNGVEWVVADLACQARGCVLVPLPGFFSAAQVLHALRASGAQALLTDDAAMPARLGLAAREVSCTASPFSLYFFDRSSPVLMPPGTGKVSFTSGSTGQPKGVCLSNSRLLAQAGRLADAVGLERPRHLCVLPLCILLENLGGVYAPLLAGGEVLIPSAQELGTRGSRLEDSRRLLDFVFHSRPHTMILTAQLLFLLATAARQGWRPPASLRYLVVGGGKVAPELVLEARRHGIPAYEGYGLSECASLVSLNTADDDRVGSCGKPLRGLKVWTEEREIIVEGNLMLGYLGERETWQPECLRTGDLGRVDAEGFLHVDGRRKNLMISTYGRNISPEWVESELLKGPLLAQAVVFGDALPYCVALVLPRLAAPDSEIQEWIDEVNGGLPDYARVARWHRLTQGLSGDPELWSDNGRPRREAIARRYGQQIAELYR